MANYEIEIKSLIGTKEKADELVEKMKAADPDFVSRGSHKQLNHYFVGLPATASRALQAGGDLKALYRNLLDLIDQTKREQFIELTQKAKDFSVRTRLADKLVLFVVKATVDDTTSSNGTARMEFETTANLSLDELDKLLLDAGFTYQAKWSRERDEYNFKGLNVTVDKNAGYGYLAEFEIVIEDPARADSIKEKIRKLMKDLDATELPQDRLERMFKFYNEHWQEYYGTEKTFNIE